MRVSWSVRTKSGKREHVGIVTGYVSHRGRVHAIVLEEAKSGRRKFKAVRLSKLEEWRA